MANVRNVLVGIGGSGQHVVHAYLKTLALTACKAIDVPHVYIVDADAKVGEAGLCSNISNLHKSLTQAANPKNRAHFALIKPYFMSTANRESPGNAFTNFELANCPSDLLDIFLSDDPSDGAHSTANDLSVELIEGMMANAKIGATAFRFKLQRVKDKPELLQLNFGAAGTDESTKFDLLSDVRGARVAIVGSSFGGTGSGVIPALVRFLEDVKPAPTAVRAFMTLPWFELGEGGPSAAATQPNGIDPKKRNASLGLRTYISDLSGEKPQSKANYVVSQFLGKAEFRADNGNSKQDENPHVFNLVLATSIQCFLNETTDTGKYGDDGSRLLFSLYSSKSSPEVDGVFSAEKSSHLRFRVKKDDNRQFLDILIEAEVLALALEKGAEFIMPGANQFKVAGSVKQTEPDTLIELCKSIAIKYDNKPLEKKGSLFAKKEVAPDEVYSKLASSLTSVSETIRRSLIWMDNHIKTEDRPSGITLPTSLNHLFNIKKSPGNPDVILPASEEYLVKQWTNLGLTIKRKEAKGEPTELKPQTERISQAFALFLNSMFNGRNYVTELDSLYNSEPSESIYDLAAQMLSDAVFAEVIEARSKFRITEHLNDAQDNSDNSNNLNGGIQAFIKGIDVSPDSRGSRLCSIDISMLHAKVGDTPGYSQDPINEDHPLSLRQLDPYLGISKDQKYDISVIAKLASGAVTFQETALKGIPNVIAPLLIHKWRLSQGVHETHEKGNLVDDKKSVRLTKFGLFQHACKVVEAGFWLTYTNDPRVTLKPLSFDNALDKSHFCMLVDAELKSELQNTHITGSALPTHALVLTDSQGNDKGKVVLVGDPTYGWYLPANFVARKFFAQIMPELPSVKFGVSNLDKAWWPSGIRESWDRNTFTGNLISAFYNYCEKRLLNLSENPQSPVEPWAIALVETRRCLKSLDGIEKAPASLDQDAKAYPLKVKLLKGNQIIDGVSLYSPKVLDQIKDLLIEKPAYFFTGIDRDGADTWNGLWPIKGSAWEFVDPPRTGISPLDVTLTVESDHAIDQRSAWQVNKLSLNLKGLGLKEIINPFGKGIESHIPGISEAFDIIPWGAAIWPKFEYFKDDTTGKEISNPWKCYYAGGTWGKDCDDKENPKIFSDFDNGNSFTATGWQLIFYGDFFDLPEGEKKTYGKIGTVEMQMPTQLIGVPRAVELVMNGRVMGSMPIVLEKLDKHALLDSKVDLAIDFGTSNTCLAIKKSGKDAVALPLLAGEPMPYANGEYLEYLSLLVGPKQNGKHQNLAHELFRNPSSPNFIFQSFNEEYENGSAVSLPSELINLKTVGYSGQANYLKSNAEKFKNSFGSDAELYPQNPKLMHQAIVTPHFTPFPPNPTGTKDKSTLSRFIGSGIKNRFKWWPEDGLEVTENYPYRSVYLEQVLMAACATLRWAGITSVSRFVGTFPLAFEETYKNDYKNHLEKIAKKCFDKAGISFTGYAKDGIVLKSETISALQSIDIGDEIAVSIDMGGGTTDVGFIVPGMNKDGKSDFFSYMSSVRFAGTHLMEALIQSPSLYEELGGNETNDEEKLNDLSIKIRNGNSFNNPSISLVAQAFFEALFEYVFSILSAIAAESSFPDKKKINIYLFGNGFRLIKVFLDRNPEDFLNSVIDSLKEENLFTPEVAKRIEVIKPDPSAKLLLIKGALKGSAGSSGSSGGHDDFLIDVEKEGHGRIALWYPCVRGGPHGEVHQMTLGTAKQKTDFEDPKNNKELSLATDDEELLKITFPITHKYWERTKAFRPIFNNVPKKALALGLGLYYLQGTPGVRSGFASVVLPALAADTQARRSIDNY